MTSAAVRLRKTLNRWSLRGFTRVVRLLSRVLPYGPGIRFGGLLGWIAFALLRRDRERALGHLSAAFPDRDSDWIRRTARRSFVHLGTAMLELMLMTPRRLDDVVRFEGLENLERAVAQGRGVVFVTGHIGNWEVMGAAVGRRFPLSVVAAPIEPEGVNDMIVGLRAGLGVRTILRGLSGASRELIRVFRENRVLGVLIDQDTDVESVFVDFMGRPARTPAAAASMALKFKASVVFGYIHREKDNRHVIRIEGPIEPVRTGNDRQDIIANTAIFTNKIEEAVLRDPEQWVWMHRRWRRQS